MFRTGSLAVLFLYAALLHASAVPAHDAEQEAQQQLIAADRGLLEAMAGPHPDVTRYAQALASDYTDIESGAAHSRDDVLKLLPGVTDFTFHYDNPHAVLLSPTTGYVMAEVTYAALVHGISGEGRVLTTTVFAQQQAKWLARLHTEVEMEPVKKAASVPESDPTLVALRELAAAVEASTHVPGYPAFPAPAIALDAGPQISFFSYVHQTVHEAQFDDLPAPMQAIWKQWAAYTTDQPSGEALFDDMFHRFFFVHELGHWMTSQVIAGLPQSERKAVAQNESSHKWDREIVANRIAVAWFRDHDPRYLTKLAEDFRQIQSRLPNPVPAGQDKKAYFTENYQKLGVDPMAYGWYQLQMVLMVYDEPARSFQQVLDALPQERYQ